MYVRRVGGGEKDSYGPYFQLVRSYREGGRVKQRVIHLGSHPTPQDALEAWPREIEALRSIGRARQAAKLQAKLDRLKKELGGG